MNEADDFDRHVRERMIGRFADDIVFGALGLAGESGEVVDQIKKMVRDDGGTMTPKRSRNIGLELGDALFYLTHIAHTLGLTLGGVMAMNVEKLRQRIAAGTLQGDGNNR